MRQQHSATAANSPGGQQQQQPGSRRVKMADYLTALQEGAGMEKPSLAIIVPFREDASRAREAQLAKFVPHMTNFYLDNAEHFKSFRVFIAEQSQDGRKFNRGKLLNFGYSVAKREGFDTLVFHDVDLLPSAPALAPWYYLKPREAHIHHIARCWSRYNKNPTYLGGILSIRLEDFERMGGFPNKYWGWGGEDDELAKRAEAHKFRIEGPAPDRSTQNWIKDLEHMDLDTKLQWLRDHREVKCGDKWEMNDLHQLHRAGSALPAWWGLGDGMDKCKELSRENLGVDGVAIKILVDLGEEEEAQQPPSLSS